MKLIELLLLTTFALISAEDVEVDDVCSIALDKYDRAALYSRNFVAGTSNKWSKGELIYQFSSDFTKAEVELITSVMREIESKSCIQFKEKKDERNFIYIHTGKRGCFANLGYNRLRRQGILHLQRNSYCMKRGTIAHEILHTLGFAHEHTRPDRDEYLKMNWDVIPANYRNNWFRNVDPADSPVPKVCDMSKPGEDYDKCYSGYKTETFGVPYDFGSVMHYGLYAGGRWGYPAMTVIKPIPEGVNVGQRLGPSELDYQKLGMAYSCNITTPLPTTAQSTTTKPTTTTTTTINTTPCFDRFQGCPTKPSVCESFEIIKKNCRKSCKFC